MVVVLEFDAVALKGDGLAEKMDKRKDSHTVVL